MIDIYGGKMEILNTIFMVLWSISMFFWIAFFIESIILMSKNDDKYLDFMMLMNVALAFIIFFCLLINITN